MVLTGDFVSQFFDCVNFEGGHSEVISFVFILGKVELKSDL